jgi:CRISPR/Cas system-associated endonuclease/helicase Cas3
MREHEHEVQNDDITVVSLSLWGGMCCPYCIKSNKKLLVIYVTVDIAVSLYNFFKQAIFMDEFCWNLCSKSIVKHT